MPPPMAESLETGHHQGKIKHAPSAPATAAG